MPLFCSLSTVDSFHYYWAMPTKLCFSISGALWTRVPFMLRKLSWGCCDDDDDEDDDGDTKPLPFLMGHTSCLKANRANGKSHLM
ncbi:hypothetical protein MLD38_004621 [Melastoma candidum]|uniref:Uncharacterized protein n=1 Tax=Melastoma candidum TaxID=119954 RepID=A0ACB9S5Y8_9MYRT|nr:hypothetical protein MLD38_004621 [Melastoma candidum]